MTIKIQCGCGSRYSFEVEPQNGVMPFRVSCPTCGADGTQEANQIIASIQATGIEEPPPPQSQPQQQPQPRLRMQTSAPPPAPAPVPAQPLPPPKAATGGRIEKLKKDARRNRMIGAFIWLFVLLVLAAAGAWGWFYFVGSKPRLSSVAMLPGSEHIWRTQFLDGGKTLSACGDHVVLHDVHADKDIWSATLAGEAEASTNAPYVFVGKDSVWVCPGDQIFRLDLNSGEVKLTIPVEGQLDGFMPTDSGILVVSETTPSEREAMSIDLASGETTKRMVEVPRAEKQTTANDLPPNVQPTAGVLLAQEEDENKFSKTLNAVSSEFFSAGENMVELRVKLLEPKITWVKSIDTRRTTPAAGDSTMASTEEGVFNGIKNNEKGGAKGIDESTYEVRLRRWTTDKPLECTNQVTGTPMFYPLQTVDLLVAGKSLMVFDKQNKPLFQAQLSYPVSDMFASTNKARPIPAVERAGVLYFFDQGVLTAFSLTDGQVKWRLTSAGISRVQFDNAGMMYIDSTAASPEDLQYTDQIRFESIKPVILKVDPSNGKILWEADNLGQHCFLTGNYVYTVSRDTGGVAMAKGLADALGAPTPEESINYNIHRLDPLTGQELWDYFRVGAPDDEVFQDNWFVLRYNNQMKAWKFLTLQDH